MRILRVSANLCCGLRAGRARKAQRVIFAPSVEEMYPGRGGDVCRRGRIERSAGWQVAAGTLSRRGHGGGQAADCGRTRSRILRTERRGAGCGAAKDGCGPAVGHQDCGLVPIVREADGLALSSRNVYLSSEERSQALVLSRAIACVERLVKEGERRSDALIQAARSVLANSRWSEWTTWSW